VGLLGDLPQFDQAEAFLSRSTYRMFMTNGQRFWLAALAGQSKGQQDASIVLAGSRRSRPDVGPRCAQDGTSQRRWPGVRRGGSHPASP
jgi:hypothetical protein